MSSSNSIITDYTIIQHLFILRIAIHGHKTAINAPRVTALFKAHRRKQKQVLLMLRKAKDFSRTPQQTSHMPSFKTW